MKMLPLKHSWKQLSFCGKGKGLSLWEWPKSCLSPKALRFSCWSPAPLDAWDPLVTWLWWSRATIPIQYWLLSPHGHVTVEYGDKRRIQSTAKSEKEFATSNCCSVHPCFWNLESTWYERWLNRETQWLNLLSVSGFFVEEKWFSKKILNYIFFLSLSVKNIKEHSWRPPLEWATYLGWCVWAAH